MLKTAYPNRRYIGQKVMATGGKVGRQKGKEIGNELTIIVTILKNLREQNREQICSCKPSIETV